jgi:hypothetical protein
MVVLDYDDGTSIESASDRWSDWPHIVHTTWSHSLALPKFRVVVPLQVPVAAALWARCWKWAEAFAGWAIDESCKDPSRIYFQPTIPTCDHPIAVQVHAEGSYLHLDAARMPPTAEEIRADQIRRARAARPSPTFSAGTPDWKLRRAAQDRLKTDAAARARVADELGARVRGTGTSARASRIECPRCGRASVWFFIEPDKMDGAQCDHRNSCAWTGWLDQLIEGVPA